MALQKVGSTRVVTEHFENIINGCAYTIEKVIINGVLDHIVYNNEYGKLIIKKEDMKALIDLFNDDTIYEYDNIALKVAREFVPSGEKISAVKEVRRLTGLDLIESKKLLEKYWEYALREYKSI